MNSYMQSNPSAIVPYPPNPAWGDPEYVNCQLTPTATNCVKTWGLRIIDSDYIFIYGAGMYSFFVNYDATCLSGHVCQQNGVEIARSEAVYIFGLFSLGTEAMVLMDQTRLVAQGQNAMIFGSGIILFEFP